MRDKPIFSSERMLRKDGYCKGSVQKIFGLKSQGIDAKTSRAIEAWYERWNIKINADKAQAIYFSHRLRPPETYITLNEWDVPFINHAKYLGVISDKSSTFRLNTEMIESKAFRTFIRFYSLMKSELLSANIKVTLHKAVIISVMTCLLRLGISDRHLPLEIAAPKNQILRTKRCTPDRYLHTALNLP
jgi:hypothetical protein